MHKSIPALCLLLDGGIKKAKPSFSLSLSRTFRNISSQLLLNPLVRPPGRCSGCVPRPVMKAEMELAPSQPAVIHGLVTDPCLWKALETGDGPRGRVGRDAVCPFGGQFTVPPTLTVPPSRHQVAVFCFHSAVELLDITFPFRELLFFFPSGRLRSMVMSGSFCVQWRWSSALGLQRA